MQQHLTAVKSRIDELTLRERGILFLVLAGLLYLLFDHLLISPQEQQQRRLLGEIAAVRSEIITLEQQKLEILERHRNDPNAAQQRQLMALQEAQQKIDDQLREAVSGLIEPQQVALALESVLRGQRQLGFVRVENLGATPLLQVEGEPTEQSDVGIYKHTMRIELEASFQQTHDYLMAMEQLPWRFHWESVELVMVDYPLARVVITVNTLSLSEGWIGV
ncbi:MAG: hypothetical protein OEZ16_00795 [Chromatiales bacterium]|nr:hypothetical protein [Chromatiales bacterium]